MGVKVAFYEELHLALQDLMNKGYKSGPSVMGVKPPKEEDPPDWSWSSGTKQKALEGEETMEERRATHTAATTGVETSAIYTQVGHAGLLPCSGWLACFQGLRAWPPLLLFVWINLRQWQSNCILD